MFEAQNTLENENLIKNILFNTKNLTLKRYNHKQLRLPKNLERWNLTVQDKNKS